MNVRIVNQTVNQTLNRLNKRRMVVENTASVHIEKRCCFIGKYFILIRILQYRI